MLECGTTAGIPVIVLRAFKGCRLRDESKPREDLAWPLRYNEHSIVEVTMIYILLSKPAESWICVELHQRMQF